MITTLVSILFFGMSFLIFTYVISSIFSKNHLITQEDISGIMLPKYLLWTILLVVAGYNFFMYDLLHIEDSVFGIGFGLFHVFALIGILLSFPKEKRTILVYTLVIAGIVSSFGSVFRASEMVQVFNLFIMRISCLTLGFVYILNEVQWSGLWILRNAWAIVMRGFRHLIVLAKMISQKKGEKRSHILKIIKTSAITLIVFLIFTLLLSQADPIFDQMMTEVREQLIERTFVSIVLGLLLFAILTYKIKTDKNIEHKLSVLGFYDIAVPVSVLVLLFAGFLFIQWKYLFASNVDFQAFDITYSDYVRKGFIELLVTSFFGSMIAYLTVIKSNETDSKSRFFFLKTANIVLIVQLFALLGSALKRDLLYIDIYGITRVRIAGGVFLACLAVFFTLVLLMNLFRRMKEKHLFIGIGAILMSAFIAVNVINIDKIIADAVPPEGRDADYFYINNLSADAISGWENSIYDSSVFLDDIISKSELTEDEKTSLASTKLALIALQNNRDIINAKFSSESDFQSYITELNKSAYDYWTGNVNSRPLEAERSWTSWNLTEHNAYLDMQDNSLLFYDGLDCLINEIADYQLTNLIDLWSYEDDRLNSFEYPLVDLNLRGSTYYNTYDMIFVAIEEAPEELSNKIEEAYTTEHGYYDQPTDDEFRKDEFGVLAELKAMHIPTSCGIK